MKSQNIDSICDSFLFISPQFNSTKNSKTIFHQNSIQKIIQNYLFPTNSIQNSIQNFEIGWIQFNKIFIQFENVGIDQGYPLGIKNAGKIVETLDLKTTPKCKFGLF